MRKHLMRGWVAMGCCAVPMSKGKWMKRKKISRDLCCKRLLVVLCLGEKSKFFFSFDGDEKKSSKVATWRRLWFLLTQVPCHVDCWVGLGRALGVGVGVRPSRVFFSFNEFFSSAVCLLIVFVLVWGELFFAGFIHNFLASLCDWSGRDSRFKEEDNFFILP